MSETETVEVEVVDLQQELAVFDPVTEAVEQAKSRCANIVLSYDTPDEIKEAKSFIYRIRKLKAPVSEVHRLAKAEAKKFVDALDGKKRELMGAIQEMIDEKEAPIKELEEKETLRLAEVQLKKEQEEEAIEQARLAEIEKQRRELAEREAKVKAEEEKIAREARERQIAEDAKKQAAIDAEAALAESVRQRQAAEDKAKQDAINAENRRRADVQREKDKAAADEANLRRRMQDDQDEKDIAARLREEQDLIYQAELESQEQERIADKAHRSKIHREIYAWLQRQYSLDMTKELRDSIAKVTTQALIDGMIPHVTINY